MLTVDEALAAVMSTAAPLPAVEVALADALGCRLAQDVPADSDSPPHNKAMMDGYAVVSGDRTSQRRVVEEITAGDVPSKTVEPGTAARIMTGAAVPAGADAVVPIERTRMVDASTVELEWIDPPPGKHVMPRGELMQRGDCVAHCGQRVTPGTVGLLAEVGAYTVKIVMRPRVTILPTGNELVDVAEDPPPGSIRNSNGPMLAAAVRAAGSEGMELPTGRDNRENLGRLVRLGLHLDVLLVTGGVSAGKLDLVPGVLADMGVEPIFHKVAMKPGKPIWFGRYKGIGGECCLVFGLPGNPVSSFVGFQVFVRPLLERLAGQSADWEVPRARLASDMKPVGDRELFHPAHVSWDEDARGLIATPVAWRGSADLRGLAAANGLLRLPAGSTPRAGQWLSVLIYGTIGTAGAAK